VLSFQKRSESPLLSSEATILEEKSPIFLEDAARFSAEFLRLDGRRRLIDQFFAAVKPFTASNRSRSPIPAPVPKSEHCHEEATPASRNASCHFHFE
jgi:hypothetical protein